mgnify:CR=1 FL=1
MAGMVILGAGQAGASLAAALRAKGYDGPVTLVGDEPAAPYQRPPLSKKYLLGEMALERLYLRPESYYAEAGIDLRLGVRVTGIDRAARAVVLAFVPVYKSCLVNVIVRYVRSDDDRCDMRRVRIRLEARQSVSIRQCETYRSQCMVHNRPCSNRKI